MATPTSTPSLLRVGVIGLGIGRHHAQGFAKHPACTLVAVADPDAARCTKAVEEFKVKTYAAAEDMLKAEKLDIVAVATPNRFHAPLTIAALQAGAHVLCEKPMAMSAAECEAMLAAAATAKRQIGINFSFRFRQQSQALHRHVATGALGRIYHGSTCWLRRYGFPGFGGWFSNKELAGGGPLIDLGVHRLDLALWLMGYPKPAWVMAGATDVLTRDEIVRSGKTATVENHAAGLIRFVDGTTLAVEASWACHRGENEWMETRLYGDKAGLVQRNTDGGYNFEARIFNRQGQDFYDAQLARSAEPERSAMEHFADAIAAGRPVPATGEQGLVVQRLLDALYRSAASGEPVKVG